MLTPRARSLLLAAKGETHLLTLFLFFYYIYFFYLFIIFTLPSIKGFPVVILSPKYIHLALDVCCSSFCFAVAVTNVLPGKRDPTKKVHCGG